MGRHASVEGSQVGEPNWNAPLEVSEFLFSKYKIHTVSIDWENIHGVRITPNVYTTLRDLDQLVAAVAAIVKT